MPSPYICKRYLLTRGCSRRKSLFLNFAENAKVAATGFERETRGDLSSLSNLSSRTKQSRPPRPTFYPRTFTHVRLPTHVYPCTFTHARLPSSGISSWPAMGDCSAILANSRLVSSLNGNWWNFFTLFYTPSLHCLGKICSKNEIVKSSCDNLPTSFTLLRRLLRKCCYQSPA